MPAVPTVHVLRMVTDLGYVVAVFRDGGRTTLAAVPRADLREKHAVTVDGEDEDAMYRCACLLATSVGIELDDG